MRCDPAWLWYSGTVVPKSQVGFPRPSRNGLPQHTALFGTVAGTGMGSKVLPEGILLVVAVRAHATLEPTETSNASVSRQWLPMQVEPSGQQSLLPSQKLLPAGHVAVGVQTPDTHAYPVTQTLPQIPQFLESVEVSTQLILSDDTLSHAASAGTSASHPVWNSSFGSYAGTLFPPV